MRIAVPERRTAALAWPAIPARLVQAGPPLAVFALAAAVRLWHLEGLAAPLNDGGLFQAMARDISDAHFGLPAYTSYNGGDIPFAYPPLALYLAAATEWLTPLSASRVFVVLP